MAHSHDEGIDPEEHEKLVEDNIAGILVPLHLCDKLVGWVACLWLTNRENEDRRHNPNSQPEEGEYVTEERQNENAQVTANVLCSCLVDSDTDSDRVPAAANAAEVKSGQSPDHVSRVFHPFVVVMVLFVLVRL